MRRATLGLVAAASMLLSACASVPDGAIDAQALACPPGTEGCDVVQPIGPGGSLRVEAGSFWFEVEDGVPITGDVEVELVNTSDAFHNFEVLGAADGSDIVEAQAFEEGEGTVKLFPGAWTVICNVPGHRQAGMEFQLTVFADDEEADLAEQNGELPGMVSQRDA